MQATQDAGAAVAAVALQALPIDLREPFYAEGFHEAAAIIAECLLRARS